MEGEDLAHVVVRNRISVAEHDVESVEVTTFSKIGSQWKVKMSGKLRVIALTLRSEFTHYLAFRRTSSSFSNLYWMLQ